MSTPQMEILRGRVVGYVIRPTHLVLNIQDGDDENRTKAIACATTDERGRKVAIDTDDFIWWAAGYVFWTPACSKREGSSGGTWDIRVRRLIDLEP